MAEVPGAVTLVTPSSDQCPDISQGCAPLI